MTKKKQLSQNNPFWKHAERKLFLAKENNEVVGRISVCVDHNFVKRFNENTGFFGFFESFDNHEIAENLFERIKAWGREKGLNRLIGPISPSINDVLGLLVDGFDSSPMIMMPYNPPYYQNLIDNLILKEIQTLFAYEITIESAKVSLLRDRLKLFESRYNRLNDLKLDKLNFDDFDYSVERLMDVYNDAWSEVWGFVPWERDEILDLAKSLKSFLIPEFTVGAEIQGELMGILVALPDYNQALKEMNGKLTLSAIYKFLFHKWKIRNLRLMIMGVKKNHTQRGLIAMLMIQKFVEEAIKSGYEGSKCEMSLIHSDNPRIRRLIENLGGKIAKTYKIFEAIP